MMDDALSLLLQNLPVQSSPILWLADEHARCEIPANQWDCRCVSNRIDVAQLLQANNYPVVLNDFDLAIPEAEFFNTACYRVSKEKPLVHYLVNQLLKRLPLGGTLMLSGFKGDGIKTYVQKACAMVDGSRELIKGRGGAQLAIIRKNAEPVSWLDDSDYQQLRNIAGPEQPTLLSKPGIFGWKKIDRGSEFLVAQLPEFFQGFTQSPNKILDLGCGYGYLSVKGHEHLPCEYIATDNNVAAVAACRANFRANDIPGEVILADCADGIQVSVDAILCNPPFHQGFEVSGQLTDRFLAATRRLLRPGGRALFVVNQFIGLEKRAENQFREVSKVAEGGGFKVLALQD